MKNVFQKIKIFAKVILGQEFLAKIDRHLSTKRFGSNYGGWDLVADPINSESTVYSFGVGEDASFDNALIQEFSLTVHAFDPTPKSIQWVKQQGFSPSFKMHEFGIASFDGTVSFNPPENSDHVSHTILDRPATESSAITVPVKRLSTIMQELGHDNIDILKMDIEGAEYDVIEDIVASNIRPRQLLVEFHHRFAGVGVKKSQNAIQKLRSIGYQLYAVSPSNEEFSFIYHDPNVAANRGDAVGE